MWFGNCGDGGVLLDFGHPLRASHASPSLCEGEEARLSACGWGWQVGVAWVLGFGFVVQVFVIEVFLRLLSSHRRVVGVAA